MGAGHFAAGGRAAVAATLTALIAGSIVLAGSRWPSVFDWLALDREWVWSGQVWRLWTAHLVHVDIAHAAVNLTALAILAGMAARMRQLGAMLRISPLLMPYISLGLLLTSPTLQWYAGLSGLLHGWAAWLLVRRGGKVAAAGLVLLGLKLLWEALPDAAIHSGIPVAIRAHQLGAAGGFVLAWAARVLSTSAPGRRSTNTD